MVVAVALEMFSSWLRSVTLGIALLAFDAALTWIIALATVSAAVLVPPAVFVRWRKKIFPAVELIPPHGVVAGFVVVTRHKTLHTL